MSSFFIFPLLLPLQKDLPNQINRFGLCFPGNPAVSMRPAAFRPRLATGSALSEQDG